MSDLANKVRPAVMSTAFVGSTSAMLLMFGAEVAWPPSVIGEPASLALHLLQFGVVLWALWRPYYVVRSLRQPCAQTAAS